MATGTQGVLINTLGRAMSPADTTLQVDLNGELTPMGRRFGIRIDNEVMEVTDNSTTNWQVNRAQNGTMRQAHAAGSPIQLANLGGGGQPPAGGGGQPPAAQLSA